MVRFATAKIPATRRPAPRSPGTSRQVQLNRVRNAPGRPVHLPSLYPPVSLNALNSSSQIGGQISKATSERSNFSLEGCSHDTLAASTNGEKQERKYVNNRYKVEVNDSVLERGERATLKVKGTPLAIGAASVLRAATAFAAGEETAEDTVHTAEDSIEKPKITTFLVVARRFGKQYVYRFNKEKSLHLFGPLNPLRKAVIFLITNQFFELLILLTIIVNCIFLAIKNAPEEPEYVFAGIYTLEMLLKIIARGFFMHKYAYLRDPWNWLDFIVVILGYVTLAPSVANLSGIRTFRVLRALRTISAIEGLRTMVNALLKSMRMLSDVLTLTTFFICIFALVGMQLFVGALRNKCVRPVPLNLTITYTEYASNQSFWYIHDGQPKVCGNASTAGSCPANYTCLARAGDNPNHGYTNFDNFGWALITAFQLVTMDFWENVYNVVLSTLGSYYIIYFMFVIFFGSFYLINLILAVVAVSYQQEVVALQDKEKSNEELKQIASSYSFQSGNLAPKILVDSQTKSESLANKCKLSLCFFCFHRSDTSKPRPGHSSSENSSTGNVKCPMVTLQTELSQTSSDTETVEMHYVHQNGDNSRENPGSKGTAVSLVPPKTPDYLVVPNADEKTNERINEGKLSKSFSRVRTLSIISERSTSDVESNCNSPRADQVNGFKFPAITSRKSSTVSVVSENRISGEKPIGTPSSYVWKKRKLVQEFVAQIVTDLLFELFITGCIMLNTIFLAMEYHDMDPTLKKVLNIGNLVFTFVFIIEMALKLIGFGPKEYIKSRWNIFDGFIVVTSVVDLALELVAYSSGAGLNVLRTFRLLRVFKLAQSWQTMGMLLSTIGGSVGQLGNLTLVLFIIVYMFAVVGMQLFGKKYTADKFGGNPEDVPRWNFADFGHACMMIFRVLCGEWIEPLYDCMRATNPASTVFFLCALVIGNFLVLNLFLALLLNAFARESLEEDGTKKSKPPSKLSQVVQRLRQVAKFGRMSRRAQILPTVNANAPDQTDAASGKDASVSNGGSAQSSSFPDMTSPHPSLVDAMSAFQTKRKLNRAHIKSLSTAIQAASIDSQASNTVLNIAQSSTSLNVARQSVPETEQPQTPEDPIMSSVDECCPCLMRQCTCECMSAWKRSRRYRAWRTVRLKLKSFVEHKFFEWAVLLIILASSFALVFEDIYLNDRPQLKKVLNYLNIVFAVIFTLEMLLKMVGLGIATYFKNVWNCLDMFIVAISIFSAIDTLQQENIITITTVAQNETDTDDNNLAAFRSLRTLRALRPLRAISRWEGMKVLGLVLYCPVLRFFFNVVVNSLLFAIPGIGNVLLVCMVFWLIFSIMGVQFFGGTFFKCIYPSGARIPVGVVPNKTVCLDKGFRWQNSNINFDNALNGFMALFQVATFEGWMEIMRDAVDARGVNLQPEEEHNFYAYFYFVVFIIVGSFFTLNLFIGVIIDNFNRLKKQYEEGGALDMFLSPSQRAWFNTLKKAAEKKPKKMISRPKVAWKAKLFDMVHSSSFETLIMAFILLNMVVMMIQHYDQRRKVELAMDIINMIFTVVFTLEAVVRIVALRWYYFKQPWNVFDFTIVIFSIVGIILEFLNYDQIIVTPSLFRVARVFRIGRLLRFYKGARGIRRLLFALIISLPALLNIGALLFLIMFIYAIIGMSSFGYVKKSGAIDDVVNFETFGSSMLLLFRISTSAGWNDVLEPLLVKPPDCDPGYKGLPNGNCGAPWLAVVYFVTFIMLTFLIIINMYIAIILENLSEAHEQEEVGITDDDIDMFYMHWERYDPSASQYILHSQLSDFVDGLEEPLRIEQPNKFACINLNIPIKQGDRIHCFDVMQALVRRVIGEIEEVENNVAFTLMKSRMEQHFISAFPQRAKTETESTTLKRIQEIRAATVIQRSYRQYRFHRELRRLRIQRSHEHLESEAEKAPTPRLQDKVKHISVVTTDSKPHSSKEHLEIV